MKKIFTNEEINSLKENQYVKNVSESTITYTEEFKSLFMTLYNNGSKPTEILRTMGFDTEILGKDRVDNIAKNLKKKVAENRPLYDERVNPSTVDTTNLQKDEQIKLQSHEIELLKQQAEFLKKNISLQEKYLSKKNY